MPITVGRAMVHQALNIMQEDDLVHFDFRCPKCKKTNRASHEQLLHSAPGWEYVPTGRAEEKVEVKEKDKAKPEIKTEAKDAQKGTTKAKPDSKAQAKPKTASKSKAKPKADVKAKAKPKSSAKTKTATKTKTKSKPKK